MKSETTTWIKTRRQLMGITQKQMAEKAGISQQLYQYFESGKRCLTTCSFNTACKVLEALGYDIAEFYHHGFSSDHNPFNVIVFRGSAAAPCMNNKIDVFPKKT